MADSGDSPDDLLPCDETLAESARSGSGAAFASLVARHGGAVYVISRNMCATGRDVEEVLQQAFLSAWRDLGSFPAGARFTTWLYGIAMNTALAHRERDPRSNSASLEEFLTASGGSGALLGSRGRWPELDGSSVERPEVT